MKSTSLDRRLRMLVSDFGKSHVERALAKIEDDGTASIPKRPKQTVAARRDRKPSASGSRPTALNRYIELACLSRPEFKLQLLKLGTMFQERRFLKDVHDIAWFLRDHGYDQRPDSRAKALKSIMEILAGMTPAELEETLARAVKRDEIGDFMMMANAIMGIPDKKTN